MNSITLDDSIPVDEVFMDAEYGRVPSPSKVDGLVDEWDADAVGVIYVSLRPDGRYAILDGWHRILAARRLGIRYLPARVYIDLSKEREARLFDWYNRKRLKPMPNETFKARLAWKDTVALRINEITNDVGLSIALDRDKHGGVIRAVGALETAYIHLGADLFRDMLTIFRRAWGQDGVAYQTAAITGLSHFLKRYPYHDELHPGRVVRVLVDKGHRGLVAAARNTKAGMSLSQTTGVVWGMVLWEFYNRGLRTKLLPEWKAHAYGPGTRSAVQERSRESKMIKNRRRG